MREKLYQLSIELTNGKWTSKMFKGFATSHLSRKLILSYAKQFKINLEEVSKPIEDFSSLHDFFIRELKAGVHQIDLDHKSVVSPVDAVIEDLGTIHAGKPVVVKGRNYRIEEMLGSREMAERYLGGTYIVFYLSPSDYHRIHAPVSGEITYKSTLGRKSFPVNQMGMKFGKDPLSKNYRQISEIRTENNHVGVVKVGAMVINTIARTHTSDHLVKGEEMAYFSFGSTVVLLFEKDKFTLEAGIKAPYPIRMGSKVGSF